MTFDYEIGPAPVDIVAGLSLQVGEVYVGQIVTRDVVVHLRESTTPPAITDPAHILVPREPFRVRPTTVAGIYLWVVSGGPARVVLTEAA